MQSTRHPVELAAMPGLAARGAGEWLAALAVLLLRALAMLVLASPLVAALVWLLG